MRVRVRLLKPQEGGQPWGPPLGKEWRVPTKVRMDCYSDARFTWDDPSEGYVRTAQVTFLSPEVERLLMLGVTYNIHDGIKVVGSFEVIK